MYREIIDMMKGQLTDRFSEILKLNFVSLLGFGNFKHYLKVSSYYLGVIIEIIRKAFLFSSSEN
jgi:hypothetical protein